MSRVTVPAHYRDHIIELLGGEGAVWTAGLPDLVDDLAEDWSLDVGDVVEPLTFNFIVSARLQDGSPCILKLGFAGGGMERELEALKFFDGRGAVRVLRDDPQRWAMLLKRVEPGTPLTAVDDDERATSIAASVMRELHRPISGDRPFPTVADLAAGLLVREHFQGGTGPFPVALVDRAQGLFRELIASSGEPVLLHGDLHHWNILDAGGGSWLAIDPKGVVGESEYEVGAFIRNPTPGLMERPDARNLLERRIHQLSDELGFDRKRVHGWSLATAVLAGWWDFEDHGTFNPVWLECAAALADLRI